VRADWDLWPWYVIGGTGSLVALHEYRIEREMRDFQRLIGLALYRALRRMWS
jgi:hypothetical protein